MTTPVWNPGTLYLPGDLVQPRTVVPTTPPVLSNAGAELGALTDWSVSAAGGTWSVSNSSPNEGTYKFNWTGTDSDARLENATHIPVAVGQVVNITGAINPNGAPVALGQNGGYIEIAFYTAANALISTFTSPQSGVQNSGWWIRTVSAVAPATASYAKAQLRAFALQGGNVAFDSITVSYPGGGSVDSGLIYQATQAAAATSAAIEPTWPTTLGGTVVDGGVTWEAVNTSRVIWEASPITESGGSEPTWPTVVGERVTDGSISWEAISRRIEDVNCPNTAAVAIMASKVFAVDGDIVRFCATINPLDWTSPDDAGYLPTGLQQANSNDMAVLNQYRSNLVAFNASSFQNWQVDPDPAAMAILDQMDGVGSTYQGAAQPVANDLFYLSQLGVRSVGISAGAENLAAGDIGMPIDPLVREAMRVAEANSTAALATYYPGAGQYWLAFSDYPPPAMAIVGNYPDGAVGDTASFTYTGSGGVAPRTFALDSGALPTGRTLGSDGVVTGTQTTSGTFSWVVRMTDADGTETTLADTAYVIDIVGTPPNSEASAAYSYTLTGTGGVAPYTFAGTPPANIVLSSAGVFSGTAPAATGSNAFNVTMTDANGVDIVKSYTIQVVDTSIPLAILASLADYWPFDGNLQSQYGDFHSFSNIYGDPSSYETGKKGQQLVGKHEYRTSTSGAFNMDWSFALWIDLEDTNTRPVEIGRGVAGGGGTNHKAYIHSETSGGGVHSVRLYCRDDSTGTDISGSAITVAGPYAYCIVTWTEAGHALTLNIASVDVSTVNPVATLDAAYTTDFGIRNSPGAYGEDILKKPDELGLWNGLALTQPMKEYLWNGGAGKSLAEIIADSLL